MKLVLLADGPWGAETLRRLVNDGHEVLTVVLRFRPSDETVGLAADSMGIPVWAPASINSDDSINRLSSLAPNLIVSMSYDQILGPRILSIAPRGAINGHAGMLPYYRGRNVLNWALINGEEEVGLTVHFMDEGIDTGDIILQRAMEVTWDDTYGSLLERVAPAFAPLVSEAVALVERGTIEPRVQRDERGTYFAARRPGDEWIDWTRPSIEVYNKIRAISRPGPGARTSVEGSVVTLWSARYQPDWPAYIANPGEVVYRWERGVTVKTGDSTIDLVEIQMDGCDQPAVPTWRIGTRFDKGPST